ncbi:MAG: N-acetyl-D-Glu racemase DgcA [Planctomycetota bacterium JB042]
MTVACVARVERWPVRGTFTIARDSYTEVEVVVVELRADGAVGRGECRPYARYGESSASVLAGIESAAPAVARGASRGDLLELLPPAAARNALDAALLDLEAKRSGRPAHELLGAGAPRPVESAFTLGLDTPARTAEAAAAAASRPLLKLKVADDDVLARVRAVREAAPGARLIVDANEAWTPESLARRLPSLAALGVALVEQPLPAGEDEALAAIDRVVPICADESCRGDDPIPPLAGRYDAVNVKLDKTGGVTTALRVAREARAAGFRVMVGCMVGTSLAMAPAYLIAPEADFADLDGPLLLDRDRDGGVRDDGVLLHPPSRELWG